MPNHLLAGLWQVLTESTARLGLFQACSRELKMKSTLVRFWNDEEGITALEYGLMAGLIAVAVIAAVGLLTDGLNDVFKNVGLKLTNSTAAQ